MSEEKEKTVLASPIMERTPAADYAEPSLTKVATNIVAEDESFIPKESFPGSPAVDLKANLKANDGLNPRVSLSHRSTAVVDCGFKLTLPPGYRAYVQPKKNLAERGLMVASTYFERESEVKVTVINIGREILYIEPGQIFAEMTVQPVYAFRWIID